MHFASVVEWEEVVLMSLLVVGQASIFTVRR